MRTTHSWEIKRNAPNITALLAEDLTKIADYFSIEVSNGLGRPNTKPEVAENYLIFNGAGPHNGQPFCYAADSEFFNMDMDAQGHCDTGRMPYDDVVRVLLFCMKHHLKRDVRISSYDSFVSARWVQAVNNFKRIFPDRDTDFYLKVADRAERRVRVRELQQHEVVEAAGAKHVERVTVDEVNYRFWKAVGPEVTVVVWDNGNGWCSIHSVNSFDETAVERFWTNLERIINAKDEEEAA